jgi:hypothetical protein
MDSVVLAPVVAVRPRASAGLEQVMAQQGDGEKATWYEEFTVSGSEVLEKVKQLIREANVRRVFIKNGDGTTILEIPLTAGVAITAITAIAAPVLVAVGAVAALLTQVTIGVERSAETDSASPVVGEPVVDEPVVDEPVVAEQDPPASS